MTIERILGGARVAILGTGWGARVQIPAFRAAGLDVTAVWGRSREKAERVAADADIPFAGTDVGEILGRDDVDLVSIVTPPSTHAELAVRALEAGKHVVCEKPTALDAGEAERMRDAARERPELLSLIDHELRFVPTRQHLRRLVADGWVGEVLHVEATFLASHRLADDKGNYRMPWDWWSQARHGGGLLGAVGSHLLDALMWTLGRRVEAVSAQLRTLIPERPDADGTVHPVDVDEWGVLHLELEDGVAGLVHMSGAVAGDPIHRLLVAGTEGTLVYQAERLVGRRLGRPEEDLTVPEVPFPLADLRRGDFQRGTLYLARALCRALGDGRHSFVPLRGNLDVLTPAATFDDGLAVQRVLDAARRSAATRSWVDVDGD